MKKEKFTKFTGESGIKERLISFATAKLAKKAGVDIETNKFYTHRGTLCECMECDNQNAYYGSYGAYTQSLLQRWFRDIHNIHILVVTRIIDLKWHGVYGCEIYVSKQSKEYIFSCASPNEIVYDKEHNSPIGTYEEALELGLQEAFKYINKI